MLSSNQLAQMFFSDLKQYNSTNFRAIAHADLKQCNAGVLKAFSSVITRYFIFCEKHPDLTFADTRLLFFHLNIDLIARYFSEYPDTDNIEELQSFQVKLRNFIKDSKHSGGEGSAASLQPEGTVDVA